MKPLHAHVRRVVAIVFLVGSLATGHAQTLRLLGRTSLPHEMPVGKTKLGGLSGISYDPATKSLWAVSDDSNNHGGAPRIYQITLQLGSKLACAVRNVVILRDKNGRPYSNADCEGIAIAGRSTAWVSSEGKAGKNGAPPWLRLFSLSEGKLLREVPLPAVYLPADRQGAPVPIQSPAQVSGVLSNRALESCSLSPDHTTLYTANETSLMQEKAPGESAGGAGIFNSTQVRIAAFSATNNRCLSEKLYVSDAGCFFGSISDVTPLDNQGNLLVLERRIVRLEKGTGCVGIRIYRVHFRQENATELERIQSVRGRGVTPLEKTLVYDSRRDGINDLDNIEGLALMPLPNHRTGLVAVSDDNFGNDQQTQILLYELTKN